MKVACLIFCLLLILFPLISFCEEKTEEKRRKSRFARPIDVSKIEKEWEQGDSEAELELEYLKQEKIAEKVGNQPFDMNSPKLAEAAAMGGTKSTMFFVDLKPLQSNGKPWTKDAVDLIAAKWQGLMKSGTIPALVYNIGDSDKKPDQPNLLVNCEKNWRVTEAMKFVLDQPETIKITKDSQVYTANSFDDDDDDDEDEDEL